MVEREIIRRVEAHTGRKVGTWQVALALHATPDKKRPTVEIVTLPEVDKMFVISNNLITEAETPFVSLIRKISTYAQKSSRQIKGTEYDFVDFAVKVGMSFDKHGSTKGVVVEIEYRPCPVTADCEQLIGELMERVAAPLVPPPQAGQDPAVSVAATTAYNFMRIEVDPKKFNVKDLVPFTKRTEALLYAKLLR